jgi:pyridoxal phosphate enzyme (YggS family)
MHGLSSQEKNGIVIMTTIGANLQASRERIRRTAAARDVCLVAVSKGQSVAKIRAAHEAGQRAFGENYVQEALTKMLQLKDLVIEWHFIGPLQSNKTAAVAQHFDWVQSVDRDKIAQRLSDARPADSPPLHICLQVNIGNEASKHGINAAEVLPLAQAVRTLPRLRLRGLMAIPEPDPTLAPQRFRELRALFDRLNAEGMQLDTLSMGMSDDFETAIACGSTMVRLGTLIFGPREREASAISRTN